MKQSPMDNAVASLGSLDHSATSRAKRTWVLMLLVAACAIIAHCQCVTYGFVPYDDHMFVYQNPIAMKGLTLQGLRYAFTDVGSDINWVPMARISHMLDIQIYGLHPWGHHLTNLILHTANVCLFFMLLVQLTGARWQAALAAILFAVHPVHVESVAWVSERRDVLSMFFGLFAMMAYVRYVRCVLAGTRWPGVGWYLLVSLCMLLSVMGKPSMVTLPCVLWLLDFWPLRRFEAIWRAPDRLRGWVLVVMEKLPWFGVVSISMWSTMQAQSKVILPAFMLPWSQRLVRVPLAYVDYFKILFWPVNLSPLYADRYVWTVPALAISIGVLLLISYVVVRNWKRRPALLTGWLWYLGTLVPMIGLVPVGVQTHACRYVYFPFLGLYVMLVWTFGRWFNQQRNGSVRNAAKVLVILVICLLVVGTWRQGRVWSSPESLYLTMASTAGVDNPLNNIHARRMLDAGKIEETRALLRASAAANLPKAGPMLDVLIKLEINQGNDDYAFAIARLMVRGHLDSFQTWEYLGDIAMHRNQPDKAVRYYKRSLEIIPMRGKVNLSLAFAYDALNQTAFAFAQLQEAIKKAPDNLYILYHAGMMYYKHEQYDKAAVLLQKTVVSKIGATDETAWYALGLSLAKTGRPSDAADAYHHALNIKPQWSEVRNSLGIVLAQMGRLSEAITNFEQALTDDPHNQTAKDNLTRARALQEQSN